VVATCSRGGGQEDLRAVAKTALRGTLEHCSRGISAVLLPLLEARMECAPLIHVFRN
jgi:hypothetical protein